MLNGSPLQSAGEGGETAAENRSDEGLNDYLEDLRRVASPRRHPIRGILTCGEIPEVRYS